MNNGKRTLTKSNVVSPTRTAGAWLLIAMLALTGCQKADQAGGGYPAVEVTTVTAMPKDTPVTTYFSNSYSARSSRT